MFVVSDLKKSKEIYICSIEEIVQGGVDNSYGSFCWFACCLEFGEVCRDGFCVVSVS